MKENRKRLFSLLTATTILLSTTGCNSIEKNEDENNNVTYSGKISLDGLDRLHIVEIKNLKGENKLYLTEKYRLYSRYSPSYYYFEIFGTDIELTNDSNGYECDYGNVLHIIPYEQFITSYIELKDNYTAEEIINVFESIKKDYDELIKNDKVKKLELK